MKKYFLLCLCFITSSIYTNAQSKYELDIIRIGKGFINNSGDDSDLNVGIEIRKNIKKKLSLGISYHEQKFSSDLADSYNYKHEALNLFFDANSSYRRSKAFMGLGLSINFGEQSRSVPRRPQPVAFLNSLSLGVVPRIGFTLDRLRFHFDYQYSFDRRITNYGTMGVSVTLYGNGKNEEEVQSKIN